MLNEKITLHTIYIVVTSLLCYSLEFSKPIENQSKLSLNNKQKTTILIEINNIEVKTNQLESKISNYRNPLKTMITEKINLMKIRKVLLVKSLQMLNDSARSDNNKINSFSNASIKMGK